jgi:hypothetical protein
MTSGDFFGYTKITFKYDVFKEDLQSQPKDDRSITFVDVFQKTELRLKKFKTLRKGDTVIISGKFLTETKDTTKVLFKGGLEFGFPIFEVMLLDVKKK